MKIALLICLVFLVVALVLYLIGASVNRDVSDDAGADDEARFWSGLLAQRADADVSALGRATLAFADRRLDVLATARISSERDATIQYGRGLFPLYCFPVIALTARGSVVNARTHSALLSMLILERHAPR